MLVNHENSIFDFQEAFDVVIVGGGTVGLFVAALLGRLDFRVGVFESGDTYFDAKLTGLNTVENFGHKHAGSEIGRARVLGGTSSLWGGQLTRFSQSDVEGEESNVGHRAWGIEYKELLELYRHVAAELNLSELFLDEYRLFDLLKIERPGDTRSIKYVFTNWLKNPNLWHVYSKELSVSKNVYIFTRAHFLSFAVDSAERKIDSINVNWNERNVSVKGHNFVLANGTVEICRSLALLANDKSSKGVYENENVGKYFQDHIDINVGRIDLHSKERFSKLFENYLYKSSKYQPKLCATDHFINEFKLNFGCSFVFHSEYSERVSELKKVIRMGVGAVGWKGIGRIFQDLYSLAKILTPIVSRYFLDKRIFAPFDQGVSLVVHCEQRPSKESFISISKDKVDAYGVPLASVNWVWDADDLAQRLQEFLKSIDEYLKTNQIGSLDTILNSKIDSEFLRVNGRDSYHLCGGAIFSNSKEDGVVNSNLRVHGIENLYVAGSAVLPNSGYANPTFTSLALSLRLISDLKLKKAMK